MSSLGVDFSWGFGEMEDIFFERMVTEVEVNEDGDGIGNAYRR